jgi:hypothetical protein
MAKFRKKPVVIEAVQWINTVGCAKSMEGFLGELWGWWYKGDSLVIETLEGSMAASPGDWIIKGVKGEFYPCKPDIFAATYEEVANG